MGRYYPLNEDQARVAWDMNHFGEFRSDELDYQSMVDEAYDIAEKASSLKPDNKERIFDLADKYAKKLADWYNNKYQIDAKCPSILIAGTANFPVAKKEKQIRSMDAHYKALREIEHIKDQIENIGLANEVIKSDDGDAIAKLEAKVAALEERHQMMKKANMEARKKGKTVPYPPYSLANRYQNIRATKQRLERLKSEKSQETKQTEVEILGERVTVVENVELMRLQLIFDGKPNEDVRSQLKKHGFRWSPKNGAWQRQLTDNARRSFKWLLQEQ